jgi:AcrR family transcriptional regulator
MAETKIARNRPRRGRPRVRPDGETRQVIYEAARRGFAAGGYGATSMESVAHCAGVSTKTLYRLFPNKAALYEGTMSDRLDRLLSGFALRATDHPDIEEALCTVLTACAALALDEEVVALQRMVLQEADKFSDVAGTFYANGVQRTAVALADWLRAADAQVDRARRRRRGCRHAARHGCLRAAARRHLRRPAAAVAFKDRSSGAHLCSALPTGLPDTRNSRNSQPLR